MQEGQESIEEDGVQVRVTNLIEGDEVRADIIDGDDDDYDNENGLVVMNFQFLHMPSTLRKLKSTVIKKNVVCSLIMTNTEMRVRSMYLDIDILIDMGSTCSVYKKRTCC